MEYESNTNTFGQKADPPLVLIMGLGAQMILWDPDFCRMLAGRGLYVVRFDNRDVGLSSKIEGWGRTRVRAELDACLRGRPFEAPYTLDDMAEDTVGLLDGLRIPRAHLVGASMGGMIAQTAAIRHSRRVASLVSLMSATGNPDLGTLGEGVTPAVPAFPPADRKEYIEHVVQAWHELSGSSYPYPEGYIPSRAALEFDRCYCPEGAARQLLAILKSGDRRPAFVPGDRARPGHARFGRPPGSAGGREGHGRVHPRGPVPGDRGHGA